MSEESTSIAVVYPVTVDGLRERLAAERAEDERQAEERAKLEAERDIGGGRLCLAFDLPCVMPQTPRETVDSWPYGHTVTRWPGRRGSSRWIVRLLDDCGNVDWFTGEHGTEADAFAEAAKWIEERKG